MDAAAQMANMGFDPLWMEMEHSPTGWEAYGNMVLVTRGRYIRPMFSHNWTCVREKHKQGDMAIESGNLSSLDSDWSDFGGGMCLAEAFTICRQRK